MFNHVNHYLDLRPGVFYSSSRQKKFLEKGGWNALQCREVEVAIPSPVKPTALLDTRTVNLFPVFSSRDALNDILDQVFDVNEITVFSRFAAYRLGVLLQLIWVQIPDSTTHHRVVQPDQLTEALKSDDFCESRKAFVVKQGAKIPGFETNLDQKRLDCHDEGVISYLMNGYPDKVTMRRLNEEWQDILEDISGPEVAAAFSLRRPKNWNIIDCDARRQERTSFRWPDALKEVSLNEKLKKFLPEEHRADREASYLLISSTGALTLTHQDFSCTSVIYSLEKGCKTFYVAPPTPNNQHLFNAFLQQDRRDLFFLGHPDLDGGGCQKITLKEREVICMPAGMIHAVETTGLSVAIG